MAASYDQFIAFGVDNAGLERLMRLIQSFFMILTSFPHLLVPLATPATHIRTLSSLIQLQSRLNITRRWLRTFRFLETLQTGWKAYMAEDKPLEIWLDAHAKTCLGLFGMLETVTLLDLIDVEHLSVFGRGEAEKLNVDAQRFWFLGLLLSAIATTVRLVKVFAFSPVPQDNDFGTIDENTSLEDEKKQLQKKKEEKKQRAKQANEQTANMLLKLLADTMDMVIPASVLGWVQVETGTVGIAMFCTSLLTGLDVWKRCGREVKQKEAGQKVVEKKEVVKKTE